MVFVQKMKLKLYFTLLSAFLPLMTLRAQELPVMPSDPNLVKEVFPNGTSCYVMANPLLKGHADFAIVQKTGLSTTESPERVVALAREALSAGRRSGNTSVQEFMTRNGASYGREGFVSVREDATIIRFDGVSTEKIDSVLLVISDIIDRVSWSSDGFVRKWYAPSDQGVIICGDVDARAVVAKMRMLSLMTPAMKSEPRREYVMKNQDSLEVKMYPSSGKVSTLTASWRLPRTPACYMNTVQPVVYEKFVHELGYLAGDMVSRQIESEGIPCADVSWRHVSSAQTGSDEVFSVSVSVSPGDVPEAARIMGSVLSSVDSGKVRIEDYKVAKHKYMLTLSEMDYAPVSRNREYFRRCLSAFLYDATLSSDKEKLSFLKSRRPDGPVELDLFSKVASAVLDGHRNLTLSLAHDGAFAEDSLKAHFVSGWNSSEPLDFCERPDTIAWDWPTHKVMLKSSGKDPLSGGQVLTFSNGFKVVYKKQASDGMLHYALALNGGFGSVSGLEEGEGAYFSEYLPLCRIGGMKGRVFLDRLAAEDMTMDIKVNLSNTIVSGRLPKDRIDLLTHALLAVANSREHDADSYRYYVRSQELVPEFYKGTFYEKMAAIDSLMCPDYRYSIYKSQGKLTEKTGLKADALFKELSSKMNDGVLVIVGDIDETKLRKHLLSRIGGFRTRKVAFARTNVRYQPVSGWSTYVVEGDRDAIDVVMSARIPLTVGNAAAASMAALVLKHHVEDALVGTGTYVRLNSTFGIYPQERFNVMLSVRPADKDAFAPDVRNAEPMEVLYILRGCLQEIEGMNLSPAMLQGYGKRLKGQFAAETSGVDYWLRAIVRRYLDGKDLTSGYEARIDAVTPGDVKDILSSLNNGSKIEYIERKTESNVSRNHSTD